MEIALKLSKLQQLRKKRSPVSSDSSSFNFEGGSQDAITEEDERYGTEDQYYPEEEIDPEDPYQINRINDIPHEHLKELYTGVVDELLDIQLEFEEKLADAEDQAKADLEAQRSELTAASQDEIEGLQNDLDKHKQAIGKLSDKVKNQQEMLKRAQSGAPPQVAVSSEEMQKLQEKIDSLTEDYNDEKKQSIKLEEQFDTYKTKMERQETDFKDIQLNFAKLEIENDELKNDLRQMGFMVEDLEQKLDSQLEMNELLTTEQDEMKQHLEEQIERIRQQLEDNQAELMVKERELKKLRFNQLMIDTQAMGQQTVDYQKNLNHTVRHSNGGAQKFDLNDQGPLSTKNQNEKGQQSRAEMLEKLKEPVILKSANKQQESDIMLPDNSQPRGSGRSLLSGELDNTSEKSQDKSSEIPAPSVAASVSLKQKSPMGGERTPSTKRNASPGAKSPGRPDLMLQDMDLGLGDLDIDNLDELLDCGDDLMDIEQTAFMGSSKVMLKMIDNMLLTIDSRIEGVKQ